LNRLHLESILLGLDLGLLVSLLQQPLTSTKSSQKAAELTDRAEQSRAGGRSRASVAASSRSYGQWICSISFGILTAFGFDLLGLDKQNEDGFPEQGYTPEQVKDTQRKHQGNNQLRVSRVFSIDATN
jgi:hypothetical protein